MSTQTFNISMPEKLVEQIDAQTKAQGGSRSDFIRQAVRKQLSEAEVSDIVRTERSKN